MKNLVGQRLQKFNTPGSMGVVKNTRFFMCYWARPELPTPIFAKGSSGIEIMGPPTPRNIIFPRDTVFLDRDPDAYYAAMVAVGLRYLVDLDTSASDDWFSAYERLAKLGGTKHPTIGMRG